MQIRKVVLGVLATLTLGAIGSGVWELLFRPGLGYLGTLFANTFTYYDNSIYTTAAMDPTPIADLVSLLLVANFPLLLVVLFVGRLYRRGRENRFDGITDEEMRRAALISERAKLTRRLIVLEAFGALFFLLYFLVAQAGFSLQNQAVVIWRVFHQNLEICAPYMDVTARTRMVAQFRRMKNASDYATIKDELNKVAVRNGVLVEWH